ncbi:MAG: copper chaperone PCu(A)C [Kiloniellales bacterium]|nr:copper chaperone PCu(A)C [Kiloniellales bacterium]
MHPFLDKVTALVLCLSFSAIVSVSAVATAMAGKEGLHAAHAWARASAGQAQTAAAYLVIHMNADESDRLLSIHSPVAKKAELHTHIEENGVMKMRPLGQVEIGPQEKRIFKPGGDHVMLIGLHAPLREGESFPLTLVFENAGEIEIEVSIKSVAARSADHGYSHGSHSNHNEHDHSSDGPGANDNSLPGSEHEHNDDGGAGPGHDMQEHGNHDS